jgi:hypothetical protein
MVHPTLWAQASRHVPRLPPIPSVSCGLDASNGAAIAAPAADGGGGGSSGTGTGVGGSLLLPEQEAAVNPAVRYPVHPLQSQLQVSPASGLLAATVSSSGGGGSAAPGAATTAPGGPGWLGAFCLSPPASLALQGAGPGDAGGGSSVQPQRQQQQQQQWEQLVECALLPEDLLPLSRHR